MHTKHLYNISTTLYLNNAPIGWMLITRNDIILMRHFKKTSILLLIYVHSYEKLPFAQGFITNSHHLEYKIFQFSTKKKKNRVQYKINHQGKCIFCACLSLQMSSVFQAHFYIHSILYRILFIFTFFFFADTLRWTFTREREKKKSEDEMCGYMLLWWWWR